MLQIPFFENTPDNTHCFQAVVKMVATFYWPEEEYSWEELDQITGKEPGMWTWPLKGYLWLQQKGLTISMVEVFDYELFAANGKAYLVDFVGQAVADEQDEHSNIEAEMAYTKQVLEKISVTKRIPTLDDIEKAIAQEKIVICNVNSASLNNRSGYSGHFVIVLDVGDSNVTIHDPGQPAKANRVVSRADFERAWASPAAEQKNIVTLVPSRQLREFSV